MLAHIERIPLPARAALATIIAAIAARLGVEVTESTAAAIVVALAWAAGGVWDLLREWRRRKNQPSVTP